MPIEVSCWSLGLVSVMAKAISTSGLHVRVHVLYEHLALPMLGESSMLRANVRRGLEVSHKTFSTLEDKGRWRENDFWVLGVSRSALTNLLSSIQFNCGAEWLSLFLTPFYHIFPFFFPLFHCILLLFFLGLFFTMRLIQSLSFVMIISQQWLLHLSVQQQELRLVQSCNYRWWFS